MEKILISACFLGENVRYNGIIKHFPSNSAYAPLIKLWLDEQRLISICPEVSGGLPTPRAPAEITRKTNNLPIIISTSNQIDVTNAFIKGAQQTLALCQKYNIRFALLKESSPSCGSQTIYDGTFSQTKIEGQGVTTALLRENGIKVFSEETIKNLIELLQ